MNGNAAPIDGKLMMIIACVGVVFNIVSSPVALPFILAAPLILRLGEGS